MGAYSLETLIRKWGRGELTVEQVVGQVLLQLQDLHKSVADLERQLYRRPSDDENDSRESRS